MSKETEYCCCDTSHKQGVKCPIHEQKIGIRISKILEAFNNDGRLYEDRLTYATTQILEEREKGMLNKNELANIVAKFARDIPLCFKIDWHALINALYTAQKERTER